MIHLTTHLFMIMLERSIYLLTVIFVFNLVSCLYHLDSVDMMPEIIFY